jgi:hypothetical protein
MQIQTELFIIWTSFALFCGKIEVLTLVAANTHFSVEKLFASWALLCIWVFHCFVNIIVDPRRITIVYNPV